MPPQVPGPHRNKKYTMEGRSIKILFACKYFLFFNPCRCLTPAHSKHLLFLTILHFSSIDFLISVHCRFSSGGNDISVHSLTAAIRFGSSLRSLSPLPSTLPSFASSLLKTSSKSLRTNHFWLLFEIWSTLRNGACFSASPSKSRVPRLFARSQRKPTHVASFDSRLKC